MLGTLSALLLPSAAMLGFCCGQVLRLGLVSAWLFCGLQQSALLWVAWINLQMVYGQITDDIAAIKTS